MSPLHPNYCQLAPAQISLSPPNRLKFGPALPTWIGRVGVDGADMCGQIRCLAWELWLVHQKMIIFLWWICAHLKSHEDKNSLQSPSGQPHPSNGWLANAWYRRKQNQRAGPYSTGLFSEASFRFPYSVTLWKNNLNYWNIDPIYINTWTRQPPIECVFRRRKKKRCAKHLQTKISRFDRTRRTTKCINCTTTPQTIVCGSWTFVCNMILDQISYGESLGLIHYPNRMV